jgi:gamma-glutamylcyclotransferase (GGCT)/AIG2-like uncharacterized protein YtfP
MYNSLFPLVFVYGTLKQGQHNHETWMRDAKLVGQLILPNYAMRIAGQGSYPAIFHTGNHLHKVNGEVFELSSSSIKPEAHLADLDRLEGVRIGLYKRVQQHTYAYGDVWLYAQDPPIGPYRWVPDGIWRGQLDTVARTIQGGMPPDPEPKVIIESVVKDPEGPPPLKVPLMLAPPTPVPVVAKEEKPEYSDIFGMLKWEAAPSNAEDA